MWIGCAGALLVALALAGCVTGTAPRTYGETKHPAELATQDRIAVGFAPAYVTAPSRHDPAAQSALAACVLDPLRERYPEVVFDSAEVLQRDLNTSEPAIQREIHWQRRLADREFVSVLTGLGFRYVIELQDQSSEARQREPMVFVAGGWGQGTKDLRFLRLQVTVVDLRQRRVAAAWNGAADGEGKSIVGAAAVLPIFLYIPPRGTDAGFVCGDLAKAVAGVFTPEKR